ncbi:MAG: 5-formyltetrahydrofolate cyclo-ligase [Pseudomonadota bacterium]
MPDKAALRRELRARRDAFVRAGPLPIPVPPEFLAKLAHGLTIASYVPIGSEADPALLARAAVAAGCQIALPHVTSREEPLRFLAWDTEAALAAGPFGLSQPTADAAELHPDLILTPLVGFDAARNRLGQGAGHYDRAFEHFPDAYRIGVAWSVQEVAALPADPWDVPLHAVLTEEGWR